MRSLLQVPVDGWDLVGACDTLDVGIGVRISFVGALVNGFLLVGRLVGALTPTEKGIATS
jgi:hypothetical protein